MSIFTKIRPVWLLVLVASTTGLLVYALGDFGAPDIIKYLTYFSSAVVLVIVCANISRGFQYLVRKIRVSLLYLKIRSVLFGIAPVRRYLTDIKLKHEVDLGVSMITNFMFNIFRLGDGLMRGAVWEILLAFSIYFW